MTEILERIPALIIGYSRVNGVERIVRELIAQEISSIYIAIDGQKQENKDTYSAFQNLRVRLSQEFPETKITWWLRDKNLGCAVSVITAIDWIFQSENRAVILEDDLSVGSSFHQYSREAFRYLKENENVLLFTGTRLHTLTEARIAPGTLSPYPVIWGWGTTDEKWKLLRSIYYSDICKLKCSSDMRVNSFWKVGLARSLNQRIDAWDVPLAYYLLKEKKLCLLPPINMISNLGFDEFATHTNEKVWPLGIKIENEFSAPLKIDQNEYLKTSEYKFMNNRVYKIGRKRIISWPLELIRQTLDGSKKINKLANSIDQVEKNGIFY